MAIAVDKELVLAGFINKYEDGTEFSLDDLNLYIRGMWNAGCGPVRLNFTQSELVDYTNDLDKVCLDVVRYSYSSDIKNWRVNKSYLRNEFSSLEEQEYLKGDTKLLVKFDLWCKLRCDFRTPNRILDHLGFRFLYE